ncbi:MAG TPA: glycosyltransferase family 4 protein, partial [Spirochaetota bacterium]|nr:glycosyltransferase family 4 protein [Spirochaetota bacterium]
MPNQKTIIYICQFAGTEQNGMTYRPYYLGKYAVKMGYRFIVFGAGYHHQMKTPKNLSSQPIYENIAGIEYIWIPAKKYNANSYLQRIKSLFAFPWKLFFYNIKSIVKDDDIQAVVSSSPSLLSSMPAIKWSKKLKTRFIFEVRDIWPMSLAELSGVSNRNPFILFLKYIEKRSYKKADKVFSVLSNAQQYMTANGMTPDKFIYIPNGVDKLSSAADPFLIKKTIFNHKFIIGYAGSIGVANNLSNLISAAKILQQNNNIHFVIIGDGPRKTEIQQQAAGMDNVSFLPPVPKNQIQTYLRQFSAGYLGLKKGKMFAYGISPNKLFDYMLAKLPVLLTVNTKNNIIAKASCGLLVSPDNPRELADKILTLYQMSEHTRKELGSNGFAFVS